MQNASLKLIALAGVVGVGFLVVLQAQRGITQPIVQEDHHAAPQAVVKLEQAPNENTERAFADGVISIEQSEPIIDDNPSGQSGRLNVSDALPQLANDVNFFPSEKSVENDMPTGTGLDFSDSGSPVQSTGFDEPSSDTTGIETPPTLTSDDSSETPRPLFGFSSSEPPVTGSLQEIESLPTGQTESPFSSEGNFFENQQDQSRSASSETMTNAEPDEFSPFETSETPEQNTDENRNADENQTEANPFFEREKSSDPQQSEPSAFPQHSDSNDLEQAQPLFNDDLQVPKKNEFFPAGELDTNGLKKTTETETLPSEVAPSPFSPEEQHSPDSEDSKLPPESESSPVFPRLDSPLLTLPESNDFGEQTKDQSDSGQTVEQTPKSEESTLPPTNQKQAIPESPVFPDIPTSLTPIENSIPPLSQHNSPLPQDSTTEAVPPETKQDFRGDGTVGRNDPRGPQQPQLKIEKIAPANAVLGQPMIYSIIVKNIGNRPAHQVVVEDQIPKGTELTGTIPQAVLAGKRLTWKVGTFKPGEQKKILVRVIPRQEGQVGSVATVHFFSEVAAETLIKAPDLEFDFSGPSQAKLGEPVVYRFKVTNRGTKDAKQVFIRDILPAGLTHPESDDLEYKVEILPVGESREIELTLTATRPGTVINRARVTAEGGIKIEKTSVLQILASPILLSRTGPKKRYIGRQTEFVNLVTNDSDQPVQNTTVKEIVPVGMRFVDASAEGKYDPGTRTITWSIDRLGPKQSQELRVTLIPTAVGIPQSIVHAVDSQGMKVVTTSQTTIEGFAALKVDVAHPGHPVGVGEQLTFRIVVRNRGTSATSNLKVRIILPDELELVSAQGPARYSQQRNEISFQPVPEVGPGKQGTFILNLKARTSGNGRLRAEISADHLKQPLIRDEAILVLP